MKRYKSKRMERRSLFKEGTIMRSALSVDHQWLMKAAVLFAQCAGGQYAVKGR